MRLRDYQQDLIARARREYLQGRRRVLMVAPCGAGKTVLAAHMCEEHAKRGGRALFVAHRRELLEQTHATFSQAGLSTEGIEIISVQTAARRLERMEKPTMIVVDEAHHAAAGTWRKLLSAFPEAWVVGLTATPCRLDGRGLGDVFETIVEGIDAQTLIQRAYLSPYRLFAPPLVSVGGLRTVAGEYDRGQVAALMDTPKVIGDAVQHYLRHIPGKKAIVYCATVEHSKHTADAFREAGIPAAHLDGDTPKQERAQTVHAFRTGAVQVLTNVDLLGEGFDVPDCDATVMLRPTKSLALYIQQGMRCMRYAPGKTAVVFDHVENAMRHGLPDDVREWRLDARKKRAAQVNFHVTCCKECYGVYESPPFLCPYCGAAPEQAQRANQPETVDGELVEQRLELLRKQRRKDEVRGAKTLDDLYRIANERGYKPGWVYHVARARGWAV